VSGAYSIKPSLETLATHGIQTTIFAATVEVTDIGVAESTEAALGNAWFALLVSPADHERTVKLARAHNFLGPVYARPRTEATETGRSRRSYSRRSSMAPVLADGINLAADGSWRDARGTWVAKADERVLGEAGRAAAIADVRRQQEKAAPRAAGAREAVGAATTQYEEVTADASHFSAARRLPDSAAAIDEGERRVATSAKAQEAPLGASRLWLASCSAVPRSRQNKDGRPALGGRCTHAGR
jgi:hypothetical protein